MKEIEYYQISDPTEAVKEIVSDYTLGHYVFDETTDEDLTFSVRIVWFCYILGGWKALACTNLHGQRYFEITYDKSKKKIYLDVYDKFESMAIISKYSRMW